MNKNSSQRLRAVPEKNVRIRHIPQELDAIWSGLNQELQRGQAVTRACMSNLIIYCDDDEQTREIIEILPEIVSVHPSRVVLLTGLGQTTEPGLDVFVSGLYRKLPGGLQVSAELIRVIADGSAHKRLTPVARGYLVSDLPTTLWWASRQPAPLVKDVFSPLTAVAGQIIYDNLGWSEPVKGMQTMSRWVAAQSSDFVIDNLAWRRTKQWRILLSQVLDPAVQPDALTAVTRVTIEHGPSAVAMASLLVGWLSTLLGWKVKGGKKIPGQQTVWTFSVRGRDVPVTLKRMENGQPGIVERIEWIWRTGDGEKPLIFADLGDHRLGVIHTESGAPVRAVSAPPRSMGAMIAAQMAHRARDRIFERAMEASTSMSGVLLS